MRNILMFILLFSLLSLYALDVSGIQTGTWELADSPFTVIGDITIPAGEELLIEPGVLVQFNGSYRLTAEGMLIAQGTETDTIYFDRYPTFSGYWDMLRLEQETGAGYEIAWCYFRGASTAVNSIDAPLHLHNCHFTENEKGVHLFAIGNPDPPEVTIEHCLIENSVMNGIDIYESNPLIQYNEIRGNATGAQYRGAIQINIQSTGVNCAPVIRDNFIHHNLKQGITLTDMFSAGTISANIQDNEIVSNLTGVYFYNCGGILSGNLITDNFIPGDMNSGAGVMCYGSRATPDIAGNTITGNYTALYITNTANPCLGIAESPNINEQGMNILQNNIDATGTNNSVYVYNCPNTYTIMAENNIWDSENFAEIAETIHDHEDVGSLPVVDFDPIYLPPVSLLEGTFNYTGTQIIQSWSINLVSVNYSWDTETYPLDYGNFELTVIPAGYYYLVIEGRTAGELLVSGVYGDFRFPEILEIDDDFQYTGLEIEVYDVIEQQFIYIAREFEINEQTVYHLIEGEHFPVTQVLLFQEGDFLKYYGRPVYGSTGWEMETFLPGEYIYQKNLNLQIGDCWSALRIWGGDESVYLDYLVTARDTLEICGEQREIYTCEATWDQAYFFIEQFASGAGAVSRLVLSQEELLQNSYQLNEESLLLPPAANSFLPLANGYCLMMESQELLLIPWDLRFAYGEEDLPVLLWNPPSAESGCQNYRIYANQELLAEISALFQQYPVPLPVSENTDFWVTGWDGNAESEPSNIITWLVPSGSGEDQLAAPALSLQQNYPNPFGTAPGRRNVTQIEFFLPAADQVKITVYDSRGRLCKTLADSYFSQGNNRIFWNGEAENGQLLPSGIYFYRLASSSCLLARKLLILR